MKVSLELFREELEKIRWTTEGSCAGGSTGAYQEGIWPRLMQDIMAALKGSEIQGGGDDTERRAG